MNVCRRDVRGVAGGTQAVGVPRRLGGSCLKGLEAEKENGIIENPGFPWEL